MKTVIIDNSLCTLPIAEGTSPELICRYIHALAETGVKYVELDFRTVMKMQELPDCVEYIFRLGDPMFAQLTQAFDFRYVVVTMHDIKDEIDVGNTPVILEIPRFEGFNRKLQALAQIRLRTYLDDKGAQQLRLYDHRTGEGACMALKKRVYRSDRRLPHGRKEDGAGYCA